MATDKQIAANRLNAQKSTGPTTAEGKTKTRLNAVKHGLTGHLEVTTDPERDAFIAGIVETLKPADPLERQLAHSIADGYWRLNRVSALENHLLSTDADDILRAINLLNTYETRLHRKVRLDLRELREIQAARRAEEAKKAEQDKAARRKAFDESCALLEMQMRENRELKPEGNFTHPNGSVFSIPDLLHSMTVNRRYQRARHNLTTNPYTDAELQNFFKPQPTPAQ